MKKLIIFILCLLSISAYAEEDPCLDFLLNNAEINLNKEQKSEISNIKKLLYSEISSKQQNLSTEENKLKSLLRNDDATDAEITTTKKKIEELQSFISSKKVKYWQDAKKILNATQSEKLRELRFKQNISCKN